MPRGRPKKIVKIEETKVKPSAEIIAAKETPRELTPREKKTNVVLRDLNKQLGGEFLKPASSVVARERLPFRQDALNKLTGGGIPYGTFTTIWGSKGCSKTTIAYQLIAEAQKRGNICLYADIERSYDALWAQQCGVDVNKLLYGAFYMAEQPLDAIIKICKEKAVDFVVLDSIQGLSPKNEQIQGKTKERSVEDDSIALLARKLSQFFRMATSYVADAKCAVLLIGQARMDLGSFIKMETLSGGHCFDEHTRVLTKSGLKYYNEIHVGDIIPTINLKNKTIEYKPIKNVYIEKFNGLLNNFKNKYNVNFLFTDKHLCLVKKYSYDKIKKVGGMLNKKNYKTILANEKRRTFAFPVSFPSGNNNYSINDDEIRFLGWVLTDGTVQKKNINAKNWRRYSNKIVIYQSKIENVKKIETILLNLNIKFKKTKRIRLDKRFPNKNFVAYEFYIYNAKRIINKYKLTPARDLPEWMFKLSDSQAIILLNSMLDGDGHRRKTKIPEYIADGNINNLEKLASFFVLHNIPVSVIKKDNRKNCWYLRFRQSDYIGFTNPQKINYSGYVWDIEVENNLHFIERCGQIIATHNSLLHNSRLILKVRRGQGADAPTEKVMIETDEVDKNGEIIIKKENKKVGFDLVVKTEKSQINGCIEGDEVHLPFYFKEGLK